MDTAILLGGMGVLASCVLVLWQRQDAAIQRCEADRVRLWNAVVAVAQGKPAIDLELPKPSFGASLARNELGEQLKSDQR